MARPSKKKQTRTVYSPEYKADALKLAEKVGVAAAAHELGRYTQQLYNWRKAALYEASRSVVERDLTDENARLKRELADAREEVALLKKFSIYMARSQR